MNTIIAKTQSFHMKATVKIHMKVHDMKSKTWSKYAIQIHNVDTVKKER